MHAVELRIPHALPIREAAERTHRAGYALAQRYPNAQPRVTWTDDRHATVDLHLLGKPLHAFVSLEPGELVIHARVPLRLRVFTTVARARVTEEAARWLSAPAPASPPAER